MLCSCRLKKKMHGMGDVLLLNFITLCLCLASVNVQPVLVNVSGCQLFNVEEFSDTPLLFQHFSVSRHFVCPSAAFCHITTCDGVLVGRCSLYCCIQQLSLPLWVNIIK